MSLTGNRIHRQFPSTRRGSKPLIEGRCPTHSALQLEKSQNFFNFFGTFLTKGTTLSRTTVGRFGNLDLPLFTHCARGFICLLFFKKQTAEKPPMCA